MPKNKKEEPTEEGKASRGRGRPRKSQSPSKKDEAKAKSKGKGSPAKGKGKGKDKGKDSKEEEKKTKKDPAAPKKGLSNYMFYGNEVRPKLMKDHPDWKVGDIGKHDLLLSHCFMLEVDFEPDSNMT